MAEFGFPAGIDASKGVHAPSGLPFRSTKEDELELHITAASLSTPEPPESAMVPVNTGLTGTVLPFDAGFVKVAVGAVVSLDATLYVVLVGQTLKPVP